MSLHASSIYPGVKPGTPCAEYIALGNKPRGNPGRMMSRSDLKQFARNPAKWLAGSFDEDTASTEWGSLVDCLALTPERFELEYAVTPEKYPAKGKKDEPEQMKDWSRNAHYCQEWEAAQEGKVVIKPDLASKGWLAAKRLSEKAEAAEILETSDRQVLVCAEWRDEATGCVIPLKCLLDLAPRAETVRGDYLADLKTTCDGSRRAWCRTLHDRWYDAQAALYLDAYNAATGERRTGFAHIVQESLPPYHVSVWQISANFFENGLNKYQEALRLYCYCLKHNYWPGYDALEEPGAITVDGLPVIEPEPYMTF